jgi:hypothetical protein
MTEEHEPGPAAAAHWLTRVDGNPAALQRMRPEAKRR